jgi:hypothetical protein
MLINQAVYETTIDNLHKHPLSHCTNLLLEKSRNQRTVAIVCRHEERRGANLQRINI